MRPSPRALLIEAKVPAFLVSNLVNIRYLTGLTLSYGFVLVLPRSYVLFADGRYIEMAGQKAPADVIVRPIADLEKTLRKVPICGFEEEEVTVGQLRKWKQKFAETKFVRSDDIVEQFRRQKSEEELKYIRRAHRITEELLRRVPSALRAGTTERTLAWKLRTWAQELGADGLAFDPVVAFGTHASRPHHQPTTRALQKGHIVLVDVGANYRGYCADRCQMYFTSEQTPIQKRAVEAVQDALRQVVDAIKPGASTRALDKLARDIIKKHGFPEFPHALGHGVGLEPHDTETILSPRAKDRALLAGEVLAIEPGTYFPGKFGVRIEEMVVVS